MVDVTLLEVNLEGAKLTANAPFSGKEGNAGSGGTVSKLLSRSPGQSNAESEESNDATGEHDIDAERTDGESERPSILPVLAFLGVVLVLALVRRRRNGGSEEQQELVEFEA